MKKPTTDLSFFKKMKVKVEPTGSYGPAGLLAATEEPSVVPAVVSDDADAAVRDMLVQNPEINGSTLYNLIKSQGMKVVKEADASGSNVAMLRDMGEKAGPGIPTDKYDSCVDQVADKVENPYALCNWSLGRVYGERMRQVMAKKKEAVKAKESAARLIEPIHSVMNFRSRLTEAAASDDGIGHTRFRVVLIQEGMGNLKDAYYYSRAALESAVAVFEGKKIYADHPTSVEESVRPERSVKDVLGHFENVALVEAEDGRSMLEADVVILPDEPYRWARALMRHSVEYAKKYPDKDFVGLSINASGDAEPMPITKLMEMSLPESSMLKVKQAQAEGVESVKVVSAIREAVSCDLVTEAGAGGRVLEMIEKEKTMKKKQKHQEGAHKELDAEKKEEAAHPAGAAEAEAKAVEQEQVPAEPAHSDEEQDKELIRKMIAEYLGEEMLDEEEVMKMAKEAYEAYREMGYEADKAMEAAGHAMKLAKHMSAKEKQEAKEGEEKKEACEQDAKHVDVIVDGDHNGEEEEKPEDEEKADAKESATVLKLKAEVAALREQMRGITVERHLEQTLRESGLPRSVTAVFREHLGTPKTTKEIDEKFKLFLETYKATKGSATDGLPFVVSTEKHERGGGADMSFADCLNQ